MKTVAQAYPGQGRRPKLSSDWASTKETREREGANILRNSRRRDKTIQETRAFRFLHHGGREGDPVGNVESASSPPDSRGLRSLSVSVPAGGRRRGSCCRGSRQEDRSRGALRGVFLPIVSAKRGLTFPLLPASPLGLLGGNWKATCSAYPWN